MNKEKEVDIIIKFKKEDIDKMFLVNKNTDPITSFYEYLIIDTNKEIEVLSGYTPNPSKVFMNKSFYKKEVYDRILKKYAKKRNTYYSEKTIELSVAMLDLDIGPNTEESVPENEIWLLKDWLKLPEQE